VEVVMVKMEEIFWLEWVLEVTYMVMQAANPNPNWMSYLVKVCLAVKVRITDVSLLILYKSKSLTIVFLSN